MRKYVIFIVGFILGLLCTIAVSVFVYPASHADKMRAGEALYSVGKYKQETAQLLLKNENVESFLLTNADAPKGTYFLYRSSSGDLIFKTIDNQLIWLHPKLIENISDIGWDCKGAPYESIPDGCS